jgi:hypothetical protein
MTRPRARRLTRQPAPQLFRDLQWRLVAALAALLSVASSLGQQPCPGGLRIDGTITDQTGALIPGAQVEAPGGAKAVADASGRYVLPCVPANATTITVIANGFATRTASISKPTDGAIHVDVQLQIASVQTDVQVNGDTATVDTDQGAASTALSNTEIQQMPDDPDDFLRQLQILAAAAGGDPSSATIMVNGFQNGSALPPKSSIAAIRVNPDMFSSEYRWPPFSGGAIEIVTKPGADSLHGALFFTDSDGSFNATDPFSVTATPASKRRYGFELTGPIVHQKSSFALALEKRDINEFNVVNAVTLDADGNQMPFLQTVPAPQRLWIASARGDWQLTPKDLATLSFASNANNLGNQGVGGLVLPEAGYDSLISEYDLRLSNSFTASANLLHETRIGYTWKRTAQTPLSAAPALQVAGYFVGGGATSQNLNNRERDLEIDHDAMLTHGKHTFKFGAQSLAFFLHSFDPDTFNGAYVFGGGSAPVLDANDQPTGGTTTISGIEQYRRAMLDLPGGNPTTYQLTSGNPLVPVIQWRMAFFLQDTIKLTPHFSIDAGLRYTFMTNPANFSGFAPRLGFAWALDRKETWVAHLRLGIFSNAPDSLRYVTEVHRLNGVRQQQATVYSPGYTDPLTPIPGSIQVSTVKQFPPSLAPQSTFVGYFNLEHDFPPSLARARQPLLGRRLEQPPHQEHQCASRPRQHRRPTRPYRRSARPASHRARRKHLPVSELWPPRRQRHILQPRSTQLQAVCLSFYYRHLNFKSNVVGTGLNSPQSTYSDLGESGRVEWSRNNYYTFTGNVVLPRKFELATQFDAGDGSHYGLTTGTDNNGDGNFNDRPAYASAPGPGVYGTRYGVFTVNTVNGDAPRILGTMPGPIHLDMNLTRAFKLNPKNTDHPHTLTFNARSANLLNRTNVTAVGTVVSSPNVTKPIAAESARRIELGARFSF